MIVLKKRFQSFYKMAIFTRLAMIVTSITRRKEKKKKDRNGSGGWGINDSFSPNNFYFGSWCTFDGGIILI